MISPLARELRASIDFFEHQKEKTVSEIFVCGGTARNDTILEALHAEAMVPCHRWDPTSFLQVDLPPEKTGELEQVAPQLTVALGAASAGF